MSSVILDKIKARLNTYNILLLIVVSIFVYLLFYGFPDSPSPWFDEGINLGIAKSWAEHGIFSLQIGPNEFVKERSLLITTNYPLLVFVALSFKLFGVGLWQAKVVMILFLSTFVVLFYFLTCKYYGKNSALVSLVLLITFLPFFGNGKSVLGEVPGLTYFLSALLILDKKKRWQVFVSGLLFGLAAATKPVFLLLVISMAFFEFLWAVRNKIYNFEYWLWFGCGIAIPLIIWLHTIFPDIASLRFLFETINLYNNPYNTSGVILFNLLRFVTESTPIHFALLLIIFILSKICIKPVFINKVEAILLIFIILVFLFFLKTVGWYRYLFPAQLLLFILFPNALLRLLNNFLKKSHIKILYPIIIMFLLTAQTTNLSLNIKDKFYYDPSSRLFAEEVNKLIKKEKKVLVVNIPEIAFLLKSDLVYQYLRNSPHSIVGYDLLKSSQFPDYIVSKPWSNDLYLKDYTAVSDRYILVLESSRFNLYALR